MSAIYLPAGVNFIICAAIIFVCICRLNHINKTVLRRVGFQYVLLLMATAGLAFAPFFWQFPGWAVVFFAGAVLFMLLADSFQWHDGPPEATTTPTPSSEL